MRARDLMTSPVVTVTPKTSAEHAAELLSEHGFTALPVVGDDDRLIGIVTEAGLVRRRFPSEVRTRRRPARVILGELVASVMTSPAVGMGSGSDIAEIARVLVDSEIRAIPIVDGSKVVGILTRGDLVRAFARDDLSIAADARHRLEIYGGSRRWKIEVHDGEVRILDEYDTEADRYVAALLVEAIPGVVEAESAYGDSDR